MIETMVERTTVVIVMMLMTLRNKSTDDADENYMELVKYIILHINDFIS